MQQYQTNPSELNKEELIQNLKRLGYALRPTSNARSETGDGQGVIIHPTNPRDRRSCIGFQSISECNLYVSSKIYGARK